jgi:hypothetical protein
MLDFVYNLQNLIDAVRMIRLHDVDAPWIISGSLQTCRPHGLTLLKKKQRRIEQEIHAFWSSQLKSNWSATFGVWNGKNKRDGKAPGG